MDLYLHSWSPADAEQPWGADPEGPELIAADLRARGVRVEHLAADLADPDAPARLVDAAMRAFGGVDVLVANHARSSSFALEDLTAAELDLTYAVNTRATLLLVKAFARQVSGPGRVVLMTSGQHRGPMPGELPYIASKGALHQLTASLAAHLAPRGITVNCVDPGATDTGYADGEAHAAVRAALADAGLPLLADRLDQEDAWDQRLSGGEQQRVALARALLLKPDWLFLDEATASLDPAAEERFYGLLKERLPGTTLVSIAHRPAVAQYHARALRVRDGQLVAEPI